MEGGYFSNSIFWVEVDRIKPNPFQPRRSFEEAALASLAESLRQYGVLQPLTVSRREIERPGEGIFVEYELIAGERRLRAAKLAGLSQVPVVIRSAEDTDRMKLELAIIENLQREDLNPIDRAQAFQRLVDDFGLKHIEVGQRVGKSREYVSNTLRILLLPEDMQQALANREISEGHTRPLLMLSDKPEEQLVLFKEIINKKLNVRDTEQIARRIAVDRARKQDLTPDLLKLEKELTETLGTRVRIEQKEHGGKVLIDFFSPEDLAQLRDVLAMRQTDGHVGEALRSTVAHEQQIWNTSQHAASQVQAVMPPESPEAAAEQMNATAEDMNIETPLEPLPDEPEDPDLYSVRNFSL